MRTSLTHLRYEGQAQDDELKTSRIGHDYFIRVMEKTLSILSCVPVVNSSSTTAIKAAPRPPLHEKSKNKTTQVADDPQNRFCLLTLENLKSEAECRRDATKNNALGTEISDTKISKTSSPGMSDSAPKESAALFAIFCLLEDLHELETQILEMWEKYHTGRVDLVTVSIATNTAYELAERLNIDFELEYPNIDSWYGILTELDASQETRSQQGMAIADLGRSMDWLFLDAAVDLHAALTMTRLHQYSTQNERDTHPDWCRIPAKDMFEQARLVPPGLIPPSSWKKSYFSRASELSSCTVVVGYMNSLLRGDETLPIQDHFTMRLKEK